MRFLDVTTIAFIGLLLHGALGLVLLMTYLTRQTYPGFRSWTASQAFWVLGSAAFFSRGWLGEPLSVLLSNPFFILCCLFIRNGMARFHGYDGDRRALAANLAAGAASVALCYWYKFGDGNVNLRIVWHSLGLSFILACAVVEPLVRSRGRSPVQAVVSAGLALAVACMLVRAWLAWRNPVYTDLFSQDAMLRPMLLMSFFGMVIAVFGFIALTHERMERDLLAARASLEQLANTDDLTGLANRRGLALAALHDIRLARRYGHPVSFVIFDLDHFKDVNDTHGHAVGDEVLAAIAARCCGVLRETDTLARWGGEEFAVLMPETGLGEAVFIAGRLRDFLRDFEPVPGVRATASFGVAELGDESFEQLAARADKALYRAKREGRDRVRTAAPA
ncbi:MAG: GGDEF domain-containing protein [Thermodesulfobacteriota bacterium]